jgi:hypothetical protein
MLGFGTKRAESLRVLTNGNVGKRPNLRWCEALRITDAHLVGNDGFALDQLDDLVGEDHHDLQRHGRPDKNSPPPTRSQPEQEERDRYPSEARGWQACHEDGKEITAYERQVALRNIDGVFAESMCYSSRREPDGDGLRDLGRVRLPLPTPSAVAGKRR